MNSINDLDLLHKTKRVKKKKEANKSTNHSAHVHVNVVWTRIFKFFGTKHVRLFENTAWFVRLIETKKNHFARTHT